jgi:hypothetical protein
MSPDGESKTGLSEHIRSNLSRVEGRIASLRRTTRLLVAISIVAGSLSAVVAGGVAVGGTAVVGSGPTGWRLVCGIASILTLAGTLSAGINQYYHLPETLGQALLCVGQLRALETSLSLTDAPLHDLVSRYENILKDHQAVLS